LDETCAAVVRYFGGTKLGTAGLVRCYREAARLALEMAGREDVFDAELLELRVPYDKVSFVKNLVDPPHVVLVEESFSDIARFRIRVRKSRLEEIERALKDLRILRGP
jgi:putative IMPACT (imprinted ancient) family translation regulator